ncbi:hypothetical protein B1218_36605, partial [Pseudomonas ogarae]
DVAGQWLRSADQASGEKLQGMVREAPHMGFVAPLPRLLPVLAPWSVPALPAWPLPPGGAGVGRGGAGGRGGRPTSGQRAFGDDSGGTPAGVRNVEGARVRALLGESVSSDHISPAGKIKADRPAGEMWSVVTESPNRART